MSQQHTPCDNSTPGPWSIRRGQARGDHFIQQQYPPWISSSDGDPVALLGGGGVWYGNAEANARLIAAAPELLELLKCYIGAHTAMTPQTLTRYDAEARALLARIEGGKGRK